MANYQYIARTVAGEKVTGVIEAANASAAGRLLGERQLFPVRVSEQAASATASFGRRVKLRDLAMFYEELADLLRAGVPMLRAIQTLEQTGSNDRMKKAIHDLAEAVKEGKGLNEAMSEQPDVFKGLQIAMVKAGERGGFLENVLADLAGYLERQDELRNKVRGALIYPTLLVMLGTIGVTAALVWLVPQFKPILENMEKPLPTKVLFAASGLITEYALVTLAGVGLLVIAGTILGKTPTGRKIAQVVQLRTPVIGKTLLAVAVTRFCRILGTMLASGVPILQALSIARDASGLPPLARAIDEAADSVRHGEGLAPPLRKSRLLPEQVVTMIAVAEESNQLERVLLKIADTVERRTNQRVEQTVRLLEPAILVVLAGVILFVALGLLYPIFLLARQFQ